MRFHEESHYTRPEEVVDFSSAPVATVSHLRGTSHGAYKFARAMHNRP